MSFLNSVLNSIGSKNSGSPSVVLPVTPARPSPPRAGDGASKPVDRSSTLLTKKRAAEDTIGQSNAKVPKIAQNPLSVGGTTSTGTPNIKGKPPAIAKTHSETPNGGPRKPKLSSKPSSTSQALSAAPQKATDEAPIKKEPKKGSYAEIMARAKANQTKAVAVGTISHKPKEKGALTHKQELKLRKRSEKDKSLGTVRGKDSSRLAPSDEALKAGKTGSKGAKPGPITPAKKAKPQPTYRGTMNPASETMKAKEKAVAQNRRRDNQYAATDDELDDEDEIEEDDDDRLDEDSDDMEAGFLDVEEEENAAATAARKEDEEEARLEAKLKREKEERKRRMEALAKRAKPQRY